jgi:DNA-binding transcriptional ArsR family regulator
MPRATTTSDAFNAIAEPRRRDLIAALSKGHEHAVNDLVSTLRLPQPTVSKHLSVLRKVGLVTVTKRGQQRFYSLQAQELKMVHDWVKSFEHFWTDHLDAIKQIAEAKAQAQSRAQSQSNKPSNN